MTRIVSQDELDVLLAPDEAPRTPAPSYDFRRPDRVSKEQLRALQFLHDRFAQNAALSLSAFLRSTTEVDVAALDQLTYAEFLSSLVDPTVFYALTMQPLEMQAALEISPVVAFAMVDRMLGGSGAAESLDRPLTEIEQNVADSVVKVLLDQLTDTWRGVTNSQFRIHARDTRPQMLPITGPNEVVIVLTFSLKVSGTLGTIRLCIPATVIEAAGDTFSQAWQRTQRAPTPEETARLAVNLGRVPLAVTAQLATTLSARELIALRPGDVLSLGHDSGHPVSVSVGNVTAYVGQLVVRNGSLAIRVQGQAPDATEGALG